MPITYATLFMIATKAMLASQRFRMTNEEWEEIGKSSQTWGKWKELYKKAEKQAGVKFQAAGGSDQF